MLDPLITFYITVALMAASGGLGFYAGGRGISGMKIDLDNTKNELEKVKNFVYPQPQIKTTPVTVPVAETKAADPAPVTITPFV